MSSIDMCLSPANSQATGVSALSNKHHNGYNQLEKALQQFAGDSVLKSDSYDSAKAFYSAVLIPLAQGGILLTDAVEETCKKFPEQYTTDVDSGDLKSEELEKEIEELGNNITRVQSLQRELRHFPVPSLVKQILMNQNQQSLTRDLEAKQELEKKLQKLQAFHASSPTIFSEISGLKATIEQGIAQANKSWNASTGQFTIPSGKNMDWANTIKNSWATRDKRLMEKQLEEYQIYAVIYNDKDGKPKVIWKVTKDGAGVKNPKIYQYLNANGNELPSDLFEFISQQDWDDKVKVAFRNGKDLQIGDKYNPVLGALVATGQYFEDAYKFMTEDELGQALQMLGFNFASYRIATNKGTKTFENKNGGGTDSILTPEMEAKILEGQRKGTSNGINGGHSPNINNANPDFATETIKVNPDGTKVIKYTKQFSDGNISKIKTSTIFPDGWSDADIINSIQKVSNSNAVGQRSMDGLTLHRGKINGVEIDVIKKGNEIISGYPVGGKPTPGFDPIK